MTDYHEINIWGRIYKQPHDFDEDGHCKVCKEYDGKIRLAKALRGRFSGKSKSEHAFGEY